MICTDLIAVAQDAILGWSQQRKYFSDWRWQLEGRGKFCGVVHEIRSGGKNRCQLKLKK
jgi:hypothetical protein